MKREYLMPTIHLINLPEDVVRTSEVEKEEQGNNSNELPFAPF